MATSMIRKLYNEGLSPVIETAKDSIAPVVTGLVIGAIGAKRSLDLGPVPGEALAGLAIRAGNAFGMRKYLGPLKPYLTHDRLADVSAAALGAGFARVGAKVMGGQATHHGELSLPPSMGIDDLVAQAQKL